MQITWKGFLTGYAATAAAVVMQDALVDATVKVAQMAWDIPTEQEHWAERGGVFLTAVLIHFAEKHVDLDNLPLGRVFKIATHVNIAGGIVLRRISSLGNGVFSLAAGLITATREWSVH